MTEEMKRLMSTIKSTCRNLVNRWKNEKKWAVDIEFQVYEDRELLAKLNYKAHGMTLSLVHGWNLTERVYTSYVYEMDINRVFLELITASKLPPEDVKKLVAEKRIKASFDNEIEVSHG